MKVCGACEQVLSQRNASGYCRKHFAANDSTWVIRRRETLRKKYATDPAALDAQRQLLRRNASTEVARRKRSEVAKRIGLGAIGWAAVSAKPGFREEWDRRRIEVYMTSLGLPREQWDTYRHIMRSKEFRSAEAVQMCLDKHELEMKRFRREIGGRG